MVLDVVADTFAIAYVATRELIAVVAVGILLSSIDDLAVDAAYLFRAFRQRGFAQPRVRLAEDPGWMAIVIPAWDEAAVIEAMLRDLTARLDYPRYAVFVGAYANDPATRAAVERVGDDRLIGITVPHPGPTSKADCLNRLWDALRGYEEVEERRFKAVVLHDAEDVVHRDELKIFDRLIGPKAMVQLPVIPLLDPDSRWIAGHYADEFAEAHGKDIRVREAIGAAVPSAGVGCAIDRDMLERIAEANGGYPFDPDCHVEDYELGLRIAALGGRGAFVRVVGTDGAVVATREHFPADFDAARRQKARWLLGIALHGWDRLGWPRNWPDRLMLMRDRKSIITALLTVLAYATLLLVILLEGVRFLYPSVAGVPPLVAADGALAWLLKLNLTILAWRLGMRAYFSGRTYGWREGLRSVPRAVIGNYINFTAAMVALRRYIAIERGREAPRWDKTVHRFPARTADC